jgi:Putative peptidoglycan-binding domain-containing protein
MEFIGKQTQGAIKLLKRGSKNELVRWCQDRLKNHKGYGIVVDSVFGSQTEAVVRQFQRDNNIVVDGIMGVQTISILI